MSKRRSAAELDAIRGLQAREAGYQQWRKGSPPPPNPTRIYRGEKRKHVVQKAMDILRDWRQSPFEHEGAVTAGLRSGLCLKGYNWHRANAEAASIVEEGLSLLGAKRPTWDQGQRDYTVPSEDCAWCGGAVPEDLQSDRFRKRFCSEICARAALTWRDFETRRLHDEVYGSAWDVIQRSRHPIRLCKHCGRPFRPAVRSEHSTGAFCSHRCKGASFAYVPERDCAECGKRFKPHHMGVKLCSRACSAKYHRKDIPLRSCAQCGELFRPISLSLDPKFCCRECRLAHGVIRRHERDCDWCGKPFIAAMPYARACSHTCASALSGMRSGKRIPKRLSPPVFDYIMRIAA